MPRKHLQACGAFSYPFRLYLCKQCANSRTRFEADIDLSCHPPLIGGHGAVLVQVRTQRLHCKTVPRKIFGSSGGSLLPTGATPSTGGHPYSTVADPEPMNSVLRVLSCGYEWGGAE